MTWDELVMGVVIGFILGYILGISVTWWVLQGELWKPWEGL